MKRSYLIQRLNPPLRGTGPLADLSAAFAFGGGLRNGGLSGEAMDLLRTVWSFDYMGAAEYEWGAVPEALSSIAKDAKSLTAFSFTVALADVAPDWRDKSKGEPDGEAAVYVLCREGDAEEVERRIRGWAADDKDLRPRDLTHLPQVLRPYDPDLYRTCGWLELTNGFLFFTDRIMWAGACNLFGVTCEPKAAS